MPNGVLIFLLQTSAMTVPRQGNDRLRRDAGMALCEFV